MDERRLVNKRLSNTAQAALEAGETYADKILTMAHDADDLLSCLSDTTQMTLAERMLRAMTVRQKLAMIMTYAHTIAGEVASVWDARRQVKGERS